MMNHKMEGRRMIQLSRLHMKLKSPELQGDWVTVGAIVQKVDARKSQNGKTYCIWKLNDLQVRFDGKITMKLLFVCVACLFY